MRLFRPRLQQLLIPFALLTSFSHPALAKTNHEGWYQVEMIVFVRNNSTTQETWPKDIKLRYPDNWVELKDPNAPPVAAETTKGPDATSLPSTPNEPANGAPASEPPLPQPDFAHEPYWQLPASEYMLADQARRLTQNPNYQVLFHQAWRQIISNRKAAKNLLIFGGQRYGQHYQLEGSINLSVATYLKIVTNLWYTDFAPAQFAPTPDAADSTSINWPELPARPNLQPLATTVSEPLTANLEGEPFAASTATRDGLMSLPPMEEDAPAFVPSRILLMKQERDMRSREVHYLDHPALGAIIKIVPFSPSKDTPAPTDIQEDLPPDPDQSDQSADDDQSQ